MNLFAPNKLAQITVLEATKMKQKSSMADGLHIEAGLALQLYKKETLAQVFSCEFFEISKNTFLQNTSERLLLYTKMMQLSNMWKDANQLRMRVLSRNSGS